MIDKILFGDFGNYSPHYLSHFYCVNFMIVLTKKPILAEKEINFGVFRFYLFFPSVHFTYYFEVTWKISHSIVLYIFFGKKMFFFPLFRAIAHIFTAQFFH